MPRAVTGTPGIITPTFGIAEHPGYVPVALPGLLQLGPAEGDTNLLQTDSVDDENLPGVEMGAIAIPAFPRGANGNRATAHVVGFSTVVRGRYFYGTAMYQRVFPTPDGDTSPGQLEPSDDEVYSEMASWSEKDGFPHNGQGQAAAEARTARNAHQADRGVGEQEQTTSGATGVWAIAGPTT